ncbi:MAG TPA: homoserine dehydrogenase [Gammaproteobacteria bacterium]|jgi:homoserine dehydrogenase|nr:homoserine dehydrogenase [Acidiferrobacteraceae bacterium]MDP6552300.1 homoserine dehydrogenase [Arenicellales bacterium]MDP6790413.1 homoserine dehydrogenase [Arenicellales bacterium]MDP6919566.1 homoserine dehydrogenase [Arenicellales bacterium]HCX86953.1 homoserine dehydrogenase [Gammaproteobacteria bacterium]|tara:strand:- start:1954 stop:3264 length:1311 start_codon:yes stop_codon:yes gene_type:complete
MKPVHVGVIGLGTVGAGTVDVLARNAPEIARRAGREITVTRAAVRDTSRPRACDTRNIALTDDPFAVVADSRIDVVLELMGGEETAFDLVTTALEHGKHVVTANKALIATRGNELFAKASEAGRVVAFEAAVAGGIPVIKVLRESLAGNRIDSLAGILNGTCNFILTEIREQGLEYGAVLNEAQRLGYAEADPHFDVGGIDAAHKLTILASIAFGTHLNFDSVHIEGIDQLRQQDIIYADELGYRIKHLGIARRQEGGLDLRVHPCLVPEEHLLANVSGVMNAVLIRGDVVGDTLHYGAGAGAQPTASAVVADLVDVVRTLTADPGNRVPHLAFQPAQLADSETLAITEIQCAHYLRLSVRDEPGVLAEVTKILGQRQVSIRVIIQKDLGGDDRVVPVVIVTHTAKEADVAQAVREIEALEVSSAPIVRIRLETLE